MQPRIARNRIPREARVECLRPRKPRRGLKLNVTKEGGMATVRLWTDDEVEKDPAVKAVFDDIRRARGSDFVNNFWRVLANDAVTLKRTWESLKAIMSGEG